MKPKPDYIIGLDLGQAQDFTAVAVLERRPFQPNAEGRDEPVLWVRHLQRFPLGTPYTTIVPAVAAMKKNPVLQSAPVVVDQTGFGRAAVDLMRRTPGMGWTVPVTTTAGQAVTPSDDHGYHVPKKELVTCLQLLSQQHRLAVASGLPDADVLLRELKNFRVNHAGRQRDVRRLARREKPGTPVRRGM
jgi:hypothetical protein